MSTRALTVGSRVCAAYRVSRVCAHTAVPWSSDEVKFSFIDDRHLHQRSMRRDKTPCTYTSVTWCTSRRGFAASSSSNFASGGSGSGSETATSVGDSSSSSSSSPDAKILILYKGPMLLPFRLLVRFKIFQLAGIGAVSAPLSAVLNNDPLSTTTAGAVAAVVGGSVACSLALQYYASRYVGEMSLLGAPLKDSDQTQIRISTMNFWGKRTDADYALSNIQPPLQNLPAEAYVEMANQVFVPLDVTSRDANGSSFGKQHVLSTRYGTLVDRKRLFQVLMGEEVDAW